MSLRGRNGAVIAALVAALALPGAALAHAALLRTVPVASATVDAPPRQVALTYDEAVEPRFAIVSVTDAAGRQETTGPPRRSPADANTLLIPLKRVAEGWYLVYWRAISVDGHPVRGAFTFAVGPNAGPAPQFPVPSTSESAATPRLVAARWVVFLSVMTAIGLLALRLGIARPVVKRVSGARLRAVSLGFFICSAIGLLAVPAYLLLATADFALRPVTDVGALVPLFDVSAFGRGYLDLELCFALFVGAATVALWLDRPERPHRSIAEILATAGAALSAAAVLVVPGAAGHAAQTAPRGLSVFLDWAHLLTGSIWIGGLAGLLILWRTLPATARSAGLGVVVPRFSNVAFISVLGLIATGTGAAIIHMPTLASMWQTSYGQAMLVKIGLLLGAMALASVNLLRTRRRIVNAQPDVAARAARLLRRLVGGEVVLVAGAIAAAAVLSSLPPPSKALAEVSSSSARVGPGAVVSVARANGYDLRFRVAPNKAAVPNTFSVQITRNGTPLRHATVFLTFAMLDMAMPNQEFRLSETSPGVYGDEKPALVMVGHWGLSFAVTPPGATPFTVQLIDHATG